VVVEQKSGRPVRRLAAEPNNADQLARWGLEPEGCRVIGRGSGRDHRTMSEAGL